MSSSQPSAPPPFLLNKHAAYIQALGSESAKKEFEYYVTEHLRVSGVYWGLAAMGTLGRLEDMNRAEIVKFVLSCQHTNGAFGGNVGHDPHLLYTLSAVQILAMLDALDTIDQEKLIVYVCSLQQEDGSFAGDRWGEIDTRFSYCAVCCLSLLGGDAALARIDVPKAVEFIVRCQNFDGGFGCIPGAESHAGQIFCCVAGLAICNALHHVDCDLLGWWLCERQLPCGGLNGRPEKKEDVCYSWWVLSSLSIIDRLQWIDAELLAGFILTAQDQESGGIADRPGDYVDVFHTFFGIAGLSLLNAKQYTLQPVDPVFALPESTVQRLGLPRLYQTTVS